ncbi:MAG: hypothetical protein WDN44_07420 [Sphingomonas sp.]
MPISQRWIELPFGWVTAPGSSWLTDSACDKVPSVIAGGAVSRLTNRVVTNDPGGTLAMKPGWRGRRTATPTFPGAGGLAYQKVAKICGLNSLSTQFCRLVSVPVRVSKSSSGTVIVPRRRNRDHRAEPGAAVVAG